MVDNLAYGREEQLSSIIKHVVSAKVGKWTEIIPLDSLNASVKFPDQYLDFVFLDSSHLFELTKAEILLWHRKIRHGGILGGHDYIAHEQVKQAVDFLIPEKNLVVEQTDQGNGLWWTEISPHVKLLN
jgi:hypothetical protein